MSNCATVYLSVGSRLVCDVTVRVLEFLEFYYYLHYLKVIMILHKGTLQGR